VHHDGVTQPPENQGWQPPPEPQPFTMPSPAPGGSQEPPPGTAQEQPLGGTAPGQTYGPYQPYSGARPGTPGYGARGYGAAGDPTARPAARDPALAEWWQRLLARLVDGIILVILTSPLWVTALLSLFRRVQRLASQYPDLSQPAAARAFNTSVSQMMIGMTGTFLLLGLGVAAVSFGYDWLQHGLWGQTIGKRVMGTKVVTVDTRAPISGQAACGRAAVYALVPAVPSVGALFALINEAWLLWDPRRQCLHDKAARTVVVKTSALASQPNSSV
jgi:uncharacterized RDD family membrane protein YckC